MAEFKDMLTYYRKRDNYSQRELAKKVGVSASTIGMYETGKRFPEKEIEESLADIFNVSLNSLRGINDEAMMKGEEDAMFLAKYHKLTDANKQVIRSTLEALLSAQDK